MKASSLGGPKPQFVDANGNPYSGAKLFFYAAGSSTKQNTYRDSTGATPNTNPIVLDSSGRPTYEVWFTDGLTYKAVLAPSTDSDPPNSPIFTVDNLAGINDVTASVDEWQASGLTPTYVGATSFTVSGDQTAAFTVGRRLKSANTAGTIYSMVSSSSYSGGTLLTTVTVVNDSGSLDSGLSSVSLSILRADHSSLPHTKSSSAGLQFSKQIEVYGTGTGTSSQLKLTRTGVGSIYLQIGGSNELIFNDNSGGAIANINATTGNYTATSDVRKKKDVTYSFDGLGLLAKLKPAMGRYKTEANNSPLRPMLIAQDLMDAIPSAVSRIDSTADDMTLGADYAAAVPVLIKALQELKAEFDSYKASHP